MSGDAALVALVAVVMVVGLAGTVLPLLPGLWLIWAGALVYTLVQAADTAGLVFMVVVTVLVVAGTAAGFLLPQREASAAGVPMWGQIAAAGGAVVGMLLIPIIGAVVGFVVAIFAVTVLHTREFQGSVAASAATIRGMVFASGAQFLVGLLIIVIWVAWLLFG